MGKGVLDSLVSYVLVGPDPYADTFRDSKQLNHLSVLEEAYEILNGCIGNGPMKSCLYSPCIRSYIPFCVGDCFTIDPSTPMATHFVSNKAFLKVRLVDICTNLFSEEGNHLITPSIVFGQSSILLCINNSRHVLSL